MDLVGDSLYEWNVQLKRFFPENKIFGSVLWLIFVFSRVDPDSQLAQDLVQLKKKENQDFIMMNILFKVSFWTYFVENFPNESKFFSGYISFWSSVRTGCQSLFVEWVRFGRRSYLYGAFNETGEFRNFGEKILSCFNFLPVSV